MKNLFHKNLQTKQKNLPTMPKLSKKALNFITVEFYVVKQSFEFLLELTF